MNISFPARSCDDIATPALLVQDTKLRLIVADLHFGIESELNSKGIYIQSQAIERKKRLFDLITRTKPEHLIILGDVKHRVPGTSRQEFREIPFLLEDLRKHIPITVCLGNHDPGLEQFLYPHEIAAATGIMIDGTSYMHGHTRPTPELAGTLIICGHHHPIIGLYDGIGIGFRTPCFVLAKLTESIWKPEKEKEKGKKTKKNKQDENDHSDTAISSVPEHTHDTRVLIIPAYNECVGYDLRQTLLQPFSPISRAIEKETAEVLLIDGSYAGDLQSMMGSCKESSA
jgi:metallophosphoesterase superfamily enzyme